MMGGTQTDGGNTEGWEDLWMMGGTLHEGWTTAGWGDHLALGENLPDLTAINLLRDTYRDAVQAVTVCILNRCDSPRTSTFQSRFPVPVAP